MERSPSPYLYVTQRQHLIALGCEPETVQDVDPRQPAHFEFANPRKQFTKHEDGSYTVKEIAWS